MLNDYLRAWQAGVSKWGNATDINSLSIGIEIDNNGFEPFTEPQINSLLQLLDRIEKKPIIFPPLTLSGMQILPQVARLILTDIFPGKNLRRMVLDSGMIQPGTTNAI